MPQNRPNNIKKFVGVASNIIVHRILIKSQIDDNTRRYYLKEVERDIDIALSYRNSINPSYGKLPDKDAERIEKKILHKVKAELERRQKEGYDVDVSFVEEEVKLFIKECNII